MTVFSDRSVRAIASALALLHAIPAGECPFVASADALIVSARARLDAGVVDVGGFEEQWLGSDPKALFAELLQSQPDSEDLVTTHGDACLPNIVMHEDGVSGFVDVGRVGASDRLGTWRSALPHT